MRVYLACTIRGDRSALPAVRVIRDTLVRLGHEVMTERFLDDRAEAEDGTLTERDVFHRDIDWLDACDLLVAEASGSSYGVGFEVGYILARAEHSGQRVVLLYDRVQHDRISRLISGNDHPHCRTVAYGSLDELPGLLEGAIPSA